MRGVVYVLVLLVVIGMILAVVGPTLATAAPTASAPQPASDAASASRPAPVIVLGTNNLTWADLREQASHDGVGGDSGSLGVGSAAARLLAFASRGEPMNLSVRTPADRTCPADAWLTLGRGKRASAIEPAASCAGPTAAIPRGTPLVGALGHDVSIQTVGPGTQLATGAPGGSANRPAPLTPSVAEALAAGADLTMVDTARDASTDAERITALDDALRTVQEQARPGTRLVIASLADDEAPGPQMAVLPAGRTAICGPGASSSAREAMTRRVPGRACSWTVRRASSRAVIRSASVEASRAVSTIVRSAPAARASATDGVKGAGLFAEPPGAPVASCVPGPTVWIETSCPSAPTKGVPRGIAAVGPAQEAAGSMALARLPRPRVSQASAGQVRSAGVRTDRFIGSPREAKASRRAAAEPTPREPESPPTPSWEACSRRSAQVRLFVPRTITGAGREAEAASEAGWGADAVGAAVASVGPTTARIMPMTTSSTRTYTTPRTRRC